MATGGLLASTWQRFLAVHGPRHAVDAAVPLLGYVVGFVVGGTTVGAVLSVVAAATVGVVRRVRGDQLRTVIVATLLVVLCAGIAAGTGDGTSFFLPEVVFNSSVGLAVLVSLLAARPLTGVVSRRAGTDGPDWRREPERFALHRRLSLLWLAFMVLRLALLVPLYVAGEVVLLATVDVVLIKPSVLFALVLTAVWVRRGRRSVEDVDVDVVPVLEDGSIT